MPQENLGASKATPDPNPDASHAAAGETRRSHLVCLQVPLLLNEWRKEKLQKLVAVVVEPGSRLYFYRSSGL